MKHGVHKNYTSVVSSHSDQEFSLYTPTHPDTLPHTHKPFQSHILNSNLLKLAARKLNIQITICTDTVKYVNIKYSTIKYSRITNTKKNKINYYSDNYSARRQ